MEQWFSLLMDLSDEIILLILNKLENVDVLYCLMDVNARLNRILHDATFTKKIDLVDKNDSVKRLDEKFLDRFCLEILPKIAHQIQSLSIESLSMERILLAADYTNLYQLDIFLINNTLDESSVIHILQNQILDLSVDGNLTAENRSTAYGIGRLFLHVLNTFTNILHLKFYQSKYCFNTFVKFFRNAPNFSSNLVELHINVTFFDDFLYLLDGHLNELRRFFVNIYIIGPPDPIRNKRNELTQLKEFSLTSVNETNVYDDVIVPHLQRMTNLESLTLYLLIEHKENFIDGHNLTSNILRHMPHLNQFLFNIHSIVPLNNQMHLPSTEHIQRSFTNSTDSQVICYVDYFPSRKIGQCCVYTYPYPMLHYDGITNSFPGGLFQYVRYAYLFDERPFEQTFFLRIAQSFPSLEYLMMKNFEPQICQDHQENNNRSLSIIEYPHLTQLQLLDIHDDYAELFLLHTKTSFSKLISLSIRYDTIQRVTRNFTRDATRVNCAKIKHLFMSGQSKLPEHFHLYFPHHK